MYIPLVPILSCLVMTDIPALFFFFASQLALLHFVHISEKQNHVALVYAFLSGILVGMSCWVRQPFLVALGASVYLLFTAGSRLEKLCIINYVITASIVAAILFFLWGGLASPAWNGNMLPSGEAVGRRSFLFLSVILALAHGSLIYAIYDPGFLLRGKKIILGTIMLSLIVVFLSDHLTTYDLRDTLPLKFVVRRVLPQPFWYVYETAAAVLFLALVPLFTFHLSAKFINEADRIVKYLYFVSALFFLAVGKMEHGYSSRYVLPAVSVLVLIHFLKEESADNFPKLLRIFLGGTLGIVIALDYLGIIAKLQLP